MTGLISVVSICSAAIASDAQTTLTQISSKKHSFSVLDASIAADNRTIALGCHDGVIRIVDANDQRLIRRYKEFRGGVQRLTYSSDQHWLASVGLVKVDLVERTYAVVLRNLLSGSVHRLDSIIVKKSTSFLLMFQPDSAQLLLIYDAESPVRRIQNRRFYSNPRIVAYRVASKEKSWDRVVTGAELTGVAQSPKGSAIVVTTRREAILVTGLPNNPKSEELFSDDFAYMAYPVFSSSGDLALMMCRTYAGNMWDYNTDLVMGFCPNTKAVGFLQEIDSGLISIEVTRDDHHLIALLRKEQMNDERSGELLLFSIQEREIDQKLKFEKEPFLMVLSPSRERLVVLSDDPTVINVFQFRSGRKEGQ